MTATMNNMALVLSVYGHIKWLSTNAAATRRKDITYCDSCFLISPAIGPALLTFLKVYEFSVSK
jgi:hypothetical protein